MRCIPAMWPDHHHRHHMMSVAIRDQADSTHLIKFQPTFRVATMTDTLDGNSEFDTGRKRAHGESNSIEAYGWILQPSLNRLPVRFL